MKIYYPARDRTLVLLNQKKTCYHLCQCDKPFEIRVANVFFVINLCTTFRESCHAGSDGSMSASGSAGPGFNPWRGHKFSFKIFNPRARRGGDVQFLIAELILQPFPSLYLRHSSFSNPSVALPTSQLILQSFCCFTYITAHSPILLLLFLCHRLFTYVIWRAAHAWYIILSIYWRSFIRV